jgi:hypothetical protein
VFPLIRKLVSWHFSFTPEIPLSSPLRKTGADIQQIKILNKFSKCPEKYLSSELRKLERHKANRKVRLRQMVKTNDSASAISEVDEELIDTLIAISVVAKRLAAKLRQNQENKCESEEHDNEQEK